MNETSWSQLRIERNHTTLQNPGGEKKQQKHEEPNALWAVRFDVAHKIPKRKRAIRLQDFP